MTKKNKVVVLAIVLILIIVLIIIYFSGFTGRFGFCPPGKKIGGGFINFCYTPSIFEGKSCDKKTDCGEGNCVLSHPERAKDKGVCDDLMRGCSVYINEAGNYNEKEVICVD